MSVRHVQRFYSGINGLKKKLKMTYMQDVLTLWKLVKTDKIGSLILQDHRLSICAIAETVVDDKESVQQIVQHINMRQVFSKIMAKIFVAKQKE